MSLLTITIIIFLLKIHSIDCIWPPSYKVNLSHEETFIISDTFSSDDAGDGFHEEEDEMIQSKDLKSFKLERDSHKYYRLHKMVERYNREVVETKNKKVFVKYKESNFDLDEPQPWQAGLVDKNGSYIEADSKIVRYSNEKAKDGVKRAIQTKLDKKRNELIGVFNMGNVGDPNYDYAAFKMEYEEQIKKAEVSKETLNYTDVKEEESFKDSVKSIVKFDTKPKNCSVEEQSGIGVAASECFWHDYKDGKTKNAGKKLFHYIFKLTGVWVCIYLLIAIPCWCQRGWCCCCFRCRVCKPQQRIDEAKKYLLDNPPGVYHTIEGGKKKVTYKPTNYEKYAQKRLEKALMKL